MITRGNDGAFARFVRPGPERRSAPARLATPAATGSLISIDTNALDFGPIGQDLAAHGGHPLSTVVHEIGHIIGIGHGGPYNGDVNAMMQQFGPYDTTLWTLMSYISPSERPTKFFNELPGHRHHLGIGLRGRPELDASSR